MTREFTAGQNGPLTAPAVRFTATASAPVDVCAFVVGDDLRVASTDDVVFYNQTVTAGVRLDGDTVVVEPDALRPGARVLCAVGCEQPASVATALHDAEGAEVATFHVQPVSGTETALLCWEIYRRNGSWKIRALGQGYAGGFAEMFPAHGVEVDDAPAESPLAPDSSLDPFELMWRIFEDAARSAAACASAHEYAHHRLDDELSAAVADSAHRIGPEAERRREAAHRRYDELVGAANARYREDSAVLTAELGAADATLPPALASWTSVAWTRAGAPSDGVRVGEVSMPDLGEIRVPLCMPVPLDGPLWLDGDLGAQDPVASALVLRLLVAQPGTLLHLVDPARCLPELAALAAPLLAGPPVHDRSLVTARLTGLADAADLGALASGAGAGIAHSPLVVVVAGMPHGYTRDDSIQLLRLAGLGAQQRISLVITGESVDEDDPALQLLWDGAEHLPAGADGRLADPWTGGQWHLTPDRLPADTSTLRVAMGHRIG